MVSFYRRYSTVSRLHSQNLETVFFLSLSHQEFLVLIWLAMKGWKAELTLGQTSRPFLICLEGCCFPNFQKVSLVVPVFSRIFGQGLVLKTTALLVFFLWLVKSEKLENDTLVDYMERNVAIVFWFPVWF